MKITFIRLFKNKKVKDEAPLMKFLRDSEDSELSGKHAISNNKKRKETVVRKRNHGNRYSERINPITDSIKEMLNKKIVKKNQVILVATALMMATAGYMNYTNNVKMADLGDAQLVSANIFSENTILEDTISENIISEDSEDVINNETMETSVNKADDYFEKTRLERDTMYSQMLETYQKILENESIPNDQKSIASNEIKNIQDRKNKIATMENLINLKGIEDVVILFNDSNVNVIVKCSNGLKEEQVAQISNIVSREAEVEIENIHISEN